MLTKTQPDEIQDFLSDASYLRGGSAERAVNAEGLRYPPDPTERGCFLGGTVATNASGSRTFKYGPTRKYVERLKIALAAGEVIDLRRGQMHADAQGRIKIPFASGRAI